jgi:hypothetical protein
MRYPAAVNAAAVCSRVSKSSVSGPRGRRTRLRLKVSEFSEIGLRASKTIGHTIAYAQKRSEALAMVISDSRGWIKRGQIGPGAFQAYFAAVSAGSRAPMSLPALVSPIEVTSATHGAAPSALLGEFGAGRASGSGKYTARILGTWSDL